MKSSYTMGIGLFAILKGEIIEMCQEQGITEVSEIEKHIEARLPQRICDYVNELLKDEHKAGIREVVEWIEKNKHTPISGGGVISQEWQAQLKEWGVASLQEEH